MTKILVASPSDIIEIKILNNYYKFINGLGNENNKI
jgi:hypothetical protein